MRKFVKKIATLVASLTMVSAMGITALAVEPYSVVGNPNFFGEVNPESTDVGWQPHVKDQIMTAVDGMTGVYKLTTNYVLAEDDATADQATKDARREFKILSEGPDLGWSFQMSLGNPDTVWGDNQTQFRVVDIQPGEVTFYVDPMKGYVAVIQNQKALDLLIRFHSRDEDPENFVEPTLANIIAEGYKESDTALKDEDYQAFINQCVVAEGGTPAADEPDSSGDDTTEANGEDTTKADETTKATADDDKEDEEEGGISTAVIIVIVVAVVAVIGIIVVVSKKKSN